MNKDFRATNPDKTKTPTPWKGLETDARIEFVPHEGDAHENNEGPASRSTMA